MGMDLFILLAAHSIGDYPLQGEFLSKYKSESLYVLFIHCVIYTAAVLVAFSIISSMHMNFNAIAIYTLISHFAIDYWKCKYRIKLSSLQLDDEIIHKKDVQGFYLDQATHLIILILLYIVFV